MGQMGHMGRAGGRGRFSVQTLLCQLEMKGERTVIGVVAMLE